MDSGAFFLGCYQSNLDQPTSGYGVDNGPRTVQKLMIGVQYLQLLNCSSAIIHPQAMRGEI